MTTIDITPEHLRTQGTPVLAQDRFWTAIWPLTLVEARRFLLHPFNLLGIALYLFTFAVDFGEGPRPAYSWITNTIPMMWGVPFFFAANLVASAARRDSLDEVLNTLPVRRDRRTAALCLATVAPFLLACLAQALAAASYLGADVELERFPSVFELVAGPLCVLGAGLLGVMVSRWMPWPGLPLLTMLALITFNVQVNEETMFGFYYEFANWGPAPYLDPWGFRSGSPGLHAAYLLGLCLLAGAGAMVRESRRRDLWLSACAAIAVAVVMVGLAQYP